MDFFEKIDTVSLGVLAEGTYTVVLVGRNFAYYDTIDVPTATQDTNFQFQITAIDLLTHQPVSDLPVELWIDDTLFTQILDTTDAAGTVIITYEYNAADTIAYDIFTGSGYWPGHYGQTQAVKGIPEVITLGLAGDF